MPSQLWGMRAAGSTGPHKETIHPPARGRKFSILLSVNLRICKISFFLIFFFFFKKKNNRKAIVCFSQKNLNSICFER